MDELKLYAVRDTESGKLVSNITNPRRKYWDRRGNAVAAIQNFNMRRAKPKHGKLELVVFKLVEVEDGK
jgi:hypothetical protein